MGDMPVQVGQTVVVEGALKQGLRAALMAYAVPLILLVVVLFVGSHFWNEDVGAVLSLSFVLLYYGILFLFRDRMSKRFRFRVIPLSDDVPDPVQTGEDKVMTSDTFANIINNK